MAGSLVRPMRVRTKCDVYTCNNMADFEIGHGLMPVIAYHLCEECMKIVLLETRELMAGKAKTENISAEEENTEITTDATDNNDSISEEIIGEVYTCKYCGEAFKKPSELNKYRSHIKKCQLASEGK